MSARARRRGGSQPGWKKSKGVAYVLAAVIGIVWIKMLWPDRPERVKIPQAYMCTDDNHITVVEDLKGMRLPMECEECGQRTAWEAYQCNNTYCANDLGEPYVFPYVIDIPEEMQGEDGEGMPAMFDPMEMGMYGDPPTCPNCGYSSMANIEEEGIELIEGKEMLIERYYTEEAREIMKELEEKYRKRRKERRGN